MTNDEQTRARVRNTARNDNHPLKRAIAALALQLLQNDHEAEASHLFAYTAIPTEVLLNNGKDYMSTLALWAYDHRSLSKNHADDLLNVLERCTALSC